MAPSSGEFWAVEWVPEKRDGSLAGVHLHVLDALLAVHLTAPHELAVALGHPTLQPRVVAPSAAQQVAAVRVVGGVLALPSTRAEDA